MGASALCSVSPACDPGDLGRLSQAFLSPLSSVHEEMAFKLRSIGCPDTAVPDVATSVSLHCVPEHPPVPQ